MFLYRRGKQPARAKQGREQGRAGIDKLSSQLPEFNVLFFTENIGSLPNPVWSGLQILYFRFKFRGLLMSSPGWILLTESIRSYTGAVEVVELNGWVG